MKSEQGKPVRTHTEQQIIDGKIMATKTWRRDLDTVLQQLKPPTDRSRERALVITRIREAIMWLGLDLKEMAGGVSCYEHGYDPSNAEVDPPADGVSCSVRNMGLSPRCRNNLLHAGIFSLDDVMLMTRGDLCRLKDFGQVSLDELVENLARRGLELKEG